MKLAPEQTPSGLAPAPHRDFTWKTSDGLTLAGREWLPQRLDPNRTASAISVLCLPGLSRNTRDFNDIAAYLQSVGHHVVALDYRGRGKSGWDPDWRNYTLAVEGLDIDAAIDHCDLQRFAVLGTSRGGLHALAMAERYPASRMAAVIFNDIGPRVEMQGLRRIAETLGQQMTYASLDDLAAVLQQTLGSQFPAFEMEDWLKLAGQLATEQDDRVVMDFDPALVNQLAGLDEATPLPELWHLYEKLTDRPILVLRGECSDILGKDTCRRMLEIHPEASLKAVGGQGHAPVLWDRETQENIAVFLKNL